MTFYNPSRWERLQWFLRAWSPRYYANGWHWLSPLEYLRMVWSRLTDRRWPYPVKGPNLRLNIRVESGSEEALRLIRQRRERADDKEDGDLN